MQIRSDRAKVESLLRAALETVHGDLSDSQIAELILAECERAKVAVRSWPKIFDAVKQIIRAARSERNWFPHNRWPQRLLNAAADDHFIFAAK